MENGIKILSVKVERKTDTDPDLSHLGEYGSEDKPGAIDREERGKRNNTREYRYFYPARSADDTGNPNSPIEDYERMESYNRGNWCMLGISAKAKIQLADNGVIQTIYSGGLWGIESDGGEVYLEQEEAEQLTELAGELQRLGCTKQQIDAAYANVERND